MLDRLAAFYVAPRHFLRVVLVEAEVPCSAGVYDGVRAVFAKPEALDRIEAHVAVHADGAEFVFEGFLHFL